MVPPQALACPECGSDYETGWSERAIGQRLGLPDEDFDYEEFVREEFGPAPARSALGPRGKGWVWGVVALGLIALLISWLMGWIR